MSPSKETFWMCSECLRLHDKSEAHSHPPLGSVPSCQQCAPTFVDESWLLRRNEARQQSSLDKSISPLRQPTSAVNSSVSPLQTVYRSRTSLRQRDSFPNTSVEDSFLNSSVDNSFVSETARPSPSQLGRMVLLTSMTEPVPPGGAGTNVPRDSLRQARPQSALVVQMLQVSRRVQLLRSTLEENLRNRR